MQLNHTALALYSGAHRFDFQENSTDVTRTFPTHQWALNFQPRVDTHQSNFPP
ncbi:hypothetical protein Mal48_14030 [Thalassoglobus polymorphus]|uniref:Uncharacterized protein n=1 Tax=Thalassoglobus polymorphus TaxID=2527994 RepID=A0A517QKK5_9PLAN|nr:hypothetical protein Mal48_14030 [Thalassoglobus polymorphus]